MCACICPIGPPRRREQPESKQSMLSQACWRSIEVQSGRGNKYSEGLLYEASNIRNTIREAVTRPAPENVVIGVFVWAACKSSGTNRHAVRENRLLFVGCLFQGLSTNYRAAVVSVTECHCTEQVPIANQTQHARGVCGTCVMATAFLGED